MPDRYRNLLRDRYYIGRKAFGLASDNDRRRPFSWQPLSIDLYLRLRALQSRFRRNQRGRSRKEIIPEVSKRKVCLLGPRPDMRPRYLCNTVEYFQASVEEQSDQHETRCSKSLIACCILLLLIQDSGHCALEASSRLETIGPFPAGIYRSSVLLWGFPPRV
jgi:hypothetical protein